MTIQLMSSKVMSKTELSMGCSPSGIVQPAVCGSYSENISPSPQFVNNPDYIGEIACFLSMSRSRFVRSCRRAWRSITRDWLGSIIASMYPRSAAT